MRRIGLMSDTHGYLHPDIFRYFAEADEIWHAGDIGTLETVRALESFRPLKAVFGNIDGRDIRALYPEDLRFNCEGVDVWMTHIGGYPGRYAPRIKPLIERRPPQLFISGHSHILKVMPDKRLRLLHINPGACGQQGWHRVKTLVRFSIAGGRVENLEVIELPPAAPLPS